MSEHPATSRPAPSDYDANPARFLDGHAVTRGFGPFREDAYDLVAERLVAERLSPALDVGCGHGRLAAALRLTEIR